MNNEHQIHQKYDHKLTVKGDGIDQEILLRNSRQSPLERLQQSLAYFLIPPGGLGALLADLLSWVTVPAFGSKGLLLLLDALLASKLPGIVPLGIAVLLLAGIVTLVFELGKHFVPGPVLLYRVFLLAVAVTTGLGL
jgi:hypothetical protein